MKAVVVVALLAVGCGGKAASKREDASPAVPVDAAVVTITAKPLGMPDLDGYRWRKRGGHEEFRAARVAENADDWAKVVAHCESALALDPGHLEAAWLLAIGYAKTGKLDKVLAPLHVAVAGDLGKWGDPSLEQPALTAFRATPAGVAWALRLDEDRNPYVAAINRAMIVVAHGDLFAFEPDGGGRWYRLTRTNGSVIGALALPDSKVIAYVTRISTKANGKVTKSLGLGAVNMTNGHATRPLDLGSNTGPFTIGGNGKVGEIWVASNAKSPPRVLADGKLADTKGTRVGGAALSIVGGKIALQRSRVKDVSADYDDRMLASAIKLDKTARPISVPSPALIDGTTIVWSPDHTHVAFVALLDETCAANVANTAAFVADATTGAMTEVERAQHGIAIEWANDRQVAVAGDKELALVGIDGVRAALAPEASLLTPRRAPPCVPAPVEPVVDDPDPE